METKMANGEQLREHAAMQPGNRRVAYESPPKESSLAWLWISLVLLGLGVAGYFIYPRLKPAQADPKGGKDAANRVTPVVSATARKGDMNIYLSGLGSVTPLNTVTVRTRVDGQLMKIWFVEGQQVHEGDPLFDIDPRPFQVQLLSAQGQMAKDEAQLKNAKADLERYEIAKEAVSRQQYDTAAANVAQFEGAIKIDQGQIDSAKLNITYSHITAPLSGRIGLKVVDEGNMVHASDSNGLAVITQLQPIAVLFSLSEDNIPKVMEAMKATKQLTVDAFDRDIKHKLASGSLLAIDSQIDQTSATVRFKAIFPNQDNALFPVQFVNARLLVDVKRGTILIPTAGVQRSPTSTFVYVVKEDNTVDMRDVVIGPSEGEDTSIESGLAAGEIVVTEGVDKLQQGAKVSLGKPGGGTTKPTTNRGATTRNGNWKGEGRGEGKGEGRGEGKRGPGGSGAHPGAGADQ
jgi:multidrug efflux system membrane fusion protein